jgi:hypothetical protein
MRKLKAHHHALFDYFLIAALGLVPPLMGYSHAATGAFYTVMVLLLIVALTTDYPVSLFSLIPLKAHGIMEMVLPFVFLLLPSMAGFASDIPARNFAFGVSAVLFLVWMISDYFVERRMSQVPVRVDRRRFDYAYVR